MKRMMLMSLLALALTTGLAVAQDSPADATDAAPSGEALGTGEGLGAGDDVAPGGESVPATEGPDGEPTTQPAGKKGKGLGGNQWTFFLIIGGVFLLMMIMSGRGRRKQESQRKKMLEELKKGDKVTSIGGICGTVIEVKNDEVVVKTDETNNIRMRFARWAIRGVGDTAKSENPADEKK